MATRVIGIRLEDSVFDALKRAAEEDGRPISSMAVRLVQQRLEEMGLIAKRVAPEKQENEQ